MCIKKKSVSKTRNEEFLKLRCTEHRKDTRERRERRFVSLVSGKTKIGRLVLAEFQGT